MLRSSCVVIRIVFIASITNAISRSENPLHMQIHISLVKSRVLTSTHKRSRRPRRAAFHPTSNDVKMHAYRPRNPACRECGCERNQETSGSTLLYFPTPPSTFDLHYHLHTTSHEHAQPLIHQARSKTITMPAPSTTSTVSTTSSLSASSTSSSSMKAVNKTPGVKLPCWCGDDCSCCIVRCRSNKHDGIYANVHRSPAQ